MADVKLIIVSHQEGLRLEDGKGGICWQISWTHVKEIAAWKEDAFAYDVICFGFRTGDESEYLSCNEEGDSWDAMQESLKARFGIKLEDWFA